MTMVSRRQLPKELEKKMFRIFYQALAELHSEKEVEEFLGDLLSPTEKIMLSKRLSIALLLSRDYDFKSIDEILKVSPITIAKVNFWLKNKGKGYRRVINKIQAQEKWRKFWQKLGDFLSESLETKRKLPTTYHPPKGPLGKES